MFKKIIILISRLNLQLKKNKLKINNSQLNLMTIAQL